MAGMHTRPRISVVIPVYNKSATLDRCIQSVLGQSYDNFEIVLVNDGSTDASGDLCDAWSRRQSHIKVIHQTNAGVSAARNTGMAAANGDWIALLDGDDAFLPDRLERLAGHVSKHDCDFVFDNIASLSDSEAGLQPSPYWPAWTRKNKAISLTEYLFQCTGSTRKSYSLLKAMISVRFLRSHELAYNVELRQSEDFELYARSLLLGARFHRSAPVGYLYCEPVRNAAVKHTSQSNVHHRVLATELVIRTWWAKLNFLQRACLLVRRMNWNSYEKELSVRAQIASRNYLDALGGLLAHPWILVRRLLNLVLARV
jgi:glycosyltransferase involved in cell wall biosynthesis